MARTKSTKTESKKTDLETLQEIVTRNQDQLQDLAGQMNALEMRLGDMLDELMDLQSSTSKPKSLLMNEPNLSNSARGSSQDQKESEVIRVAKDNGVYMLKFRSFNFFRWLGVLTVGAVIGIIIMGIFG